jgi:hypothetical protein
MEVATWLTRVEVLELEYRTGLGDATGAQADAVLARATSLLKEPREDPSLYEVAARTRGARAELVLRMHADATADIEACLGLAEKAVAAGPGMASTHARLGLCRLLQARAERDPAKRKEAARLAAEALAAAVRKNPLLARRHAEPIREAEKLRGE